MQNNLSLPYRQFVENGGTLLGLRINDRYLIIKELGAGRYGTVFKAFDKQKDRIVAVKLLDIHALESSSIE